MWHGQLLEAIPRITKKDLDDKYFYFKDQKTFVEMKRYYNKKLDYLKQQCLWDELKPLFNIPKIGTCWYKVNNYYFLLKRLVTDPKVITIYPDDILETEDKLDIDVLAVLLFRWFWGLSCTYTGIKLRYNYKTANTVAISWSESIFTGEKMSLPQRVHSTIIRQHGGVDRYFLDLLGIIDQKSLGVFHKNISNIVKRVYPEMGDIIEFGIRKLTRMYQRSQIKFE